MFGPVHSIKKEENQNFVKRDFILRTFPTFPKLRATLGLVSNLHVRRVFKISP